LKLREINRRENFYCATELRKTKVITEITVLAGVFSLWTEVFCYDVNRCFLSDERRPAMKNFGQRFWAALFFVGLASLGADCMAQSGERVMPQPAPRQQVDVVFVLDTTGSMTGLIEGAKRKIWAIANTIIDQHPEAQIRMGLVAYRDIGDNYVTQSHPLTPDIQGIYGKLLTFRAAGGGDTPESVNEALDVAVGQQPWLEANAPGQNSRILFLVGDAPPHMDYKQDRKYPEIIREARQKNILVNTVQAGDSNETRKVWQEMARLGAGEYIAIPQDGGRIVVIETPYDEEIVIIQRQLNVTVIPYGKRESQARVLITSEINDYGF
jgi:uncharacterized protein YegL